MKPEDQNRLAYYWKLFQEETKQRSEFYDKSVRMILTIPLFVNAGAAIALTNFYTSKNPDWNITLATTAFVCGTIFGILTLVFEFFAAYFAASDFHSYLHLFKEKADKGEEEMLAELKKHFGFYLIYMKKIRGTILLRIINGAVSIFFCFLGIYFIGAYLLQSYCVPAIILISLFIYLCISLIWMKSKFKLQQC